MIFDAGDDHSLTMGADAPATAPAFSASLTAAEVEWMRLEIDAAGKEIDAMKRYEQVQRELFEASRDVMLQALRTECSRANDACARACKAEKREERLRKALWAAATACALETLALLWVVLR